MLGLLETSLSFDNAVVNASVLGGWSGPWRKRFITFGMPVAVFGMRLLFPLLVVAVVSHTGPVAVLDLAIHNPANYVATLAMAHNQIVAFGGAFLSMVFLSYFLDREKEEHWLGFIEHPLTTISKYGLTEISVTLILICLTSLLVPDAQQKSYLYAGIAGMVTHMAAEALGSLVSGEDAEGGGEGANRIIKEGVAGLLYLELLDASFSFDGVIGAFAVSNNLFIIALGLGIGAMFVRSLTLLLVDKGTLTMYRYLEHGAFWAIAVLTGIMFASIRFEIPDVVTGGVGAGLIGLALWSSILANRKEAGTAAQAT